MSLLSVVLGLASLVSPAQAATPQDIAHGWYLASSGRLEEAAQTAAVGLEENPADLAAQELYISMLSDALLEDAALLRQYASWVAESPDDSTARTAYAMALSITHHDGGIWCKEFRAMLDPLPVDTGLRYWALAYRYRTRDRCPTDVAADKKALLQLALVTPTAAGLGLELRLDEGAVDEVLAADLRTFYDAEPWNLDKPGNLWRDDLKGSALKTARADALNAASEALKSNEPAAAVAAFRVYQQASNDPGRVRAEMRRAELDPAWSSNDRSWTGERLSLTEEGARSNLEREIERARQKASTEAAYVALKALDHRVPATGPLRAMWMKELGMVQFREGRADEAFATFKAAWQIDPSNPSVANAFAYSSALKGQELELALVAMDSVLKKFPIYDPWRDYQHRGYEAWAAKTSNQAAARLDTEGWILYELGRTEEAAAVLQRALLHDHEADPVMHHHLGFVLAALSRNDAALEQFKIGLSMGPSDEQDLDARARARAEKLFMGRRWNPRGFEGWLASHVPPDPALCANSCVGQPFPAISFHVGEATKTLADYPGVRVIVFWASSSTPFLKSMPYLDTVARKVAERGVRVITLGIDPNPGDVTWFWEGTKHPPYLVGWAGPAVRETMGFARLPAFFVVDEQGAIRGNFTGYGGHDDHRLEDQIEAVKIAKQ
jgi:tetratricopeptide (TPR) repeat protein